MTPQASHLRSEQLPARVARPAAQVLFWCDTTRRQTFETGIQRVTRRLADGLAQHGIEVIPVGWSSRYRLIEFLGRTSCPSAELDRLPTGADGGWLLIPEIPMTVLGDNLDPVQLGRALGLRTAAIVHDLIPVRLAHLYDEETVRLYRRYYCMFANADLVLATTRLVAGQLRDHLQTEQLCIPKTVVVPLPAEFPGTSRCKVKSVAHGTNCLLKLLTVSTWEPRKNLPCLLRAVQMAEKRSGRAIALTIVGRRGVYPAYDAEVDALLAGMPSVAVLARTGDDELAALYQSHHASVYPSYEEGFGLPILESLWLGTPCLCHVGSSMAEVAPGGGTLMLDMTDETELADMIIDLACRPDLVDRLTSETLVRPLRSWANYADDVAHWLPEDHLS